MNDAGTARTGHLSADMRICHDGGYDNAALPGGDIAGNLGSVTTQTDVPASTLTRCSTFPATSAAVGSARSFARETASALELPNLAGDLVLVVSELVTNAVLHGTGPVTVRLSGLPGAVLCEVADSGAWAPRAYEPGPDVEHGRGLALVVAFAERFGVRAGGCHGESSGKTVWCCVDGGQG